MLDFPASPTNGQQYTAAGVTWTWDGAKWTASGLNVAYLPLTGGTLTGDLTIAETYSRLVLNKSAASGNNIVAGMSGGLQRWNMVLGNSDAETGGNAGSNFYISALADNQVGLGQPLAINRATGIVTIPALSAPQAIGDNRIINGDMRIDQRNQGASITPTAGPAFTVDRWKLQLAQPSKFSAARALLGAGMNALGWTYCLNLATAAAYTALATDNFALTQFIEADMMGDFGWGTSGAQPVTLSFMALGSIAGTYGGSIRNDTNTRSYPFSFALAANTWTKVVITIPGDTAGTWVLSGNALGAYVAFDLGSGANLRGPVNAWATTPSPGYSGVAGAVSMIANAGATMSFTGVKLEIGSVATPYNRQSLAKSMADCQRYYSTNTVSLLVYGGAGGAQGQTLFFPVSMRATPTMNSSGGVFQNGSTLAVDNIQPQSVRATITITAAGAAALNGWTYTANAEL